MLSILLSILSLILFVILSFIDLIFLMFKDAKKRKWYQLIDGRAFNKAFNVDVFGNYQFKELWNWALTKDHGYSFGVIGETISSALGKNVKLKTLSNTGWLLCYIIDFIDVSKWKSGFKGNGFHCVASIQTDEEIIKFIKRV